LEALFYPIDQNNIAQIPLFNINKEDTIMWMYEATRPYSVKYGYKALQGWK